MEFSEKELKDYEKALQAFDWFYDYSDCHRTFKAGEQEFARLKQWQSLVDPEFKIWKKYSV